jgi:DUF1365 family protein
MVLLVLSRSVSDLGFRFSMENSLYRGNLLHKRILPVKHVFQYDHACLYVNIEDIQKVAESSPLVSVESPNVLSFYRQDFLPSLRPLYDEVCSRIDEQTGQVFAGDIYLLANWRTCGVTMNPLSLFYCFENELLQYVVAEVHNTPWNERHVYVLDVANSALVSEKKFHVSPFMPMDLNYLWILDTPGRSLEVSIHLDHQNDKLFVVTMKLAAQPITRSSLHKMIWRFPVMAARTVMYIYYQAFRLWLKHVPFFAHPKNI